MDPATALLAFNAAIKLAETLAPIVGPMITGGEITKEQQSETKANLDALRAGVGKFSGPEWEVKK